MTTSISYDYYDPGQDYTNMMSYSAYLGSLAGVPDYQGGASIWSMMYLMAMMCQFDTDTVGQDAWIDNDINEIKGLTEGLNQDINAGNSTTHTQATDGTTLYYCEIDGKTYYCDKLAVGKTATVNGQTYTIKESDTLDYKIRGDIDDIESRIHADPYFQENPDLADQMVDDLEDLWTHIDGEGYGNGNVHHMWYETDPQHFEEEGFTPSKNLDEPQTDENGDPVLGDAGIMQPVTDDLDGVQAVLTNGDEVMQNIIKSVTSLVETEQDTMNNMYKSFDKMEDSINSHMLQGT